MKINMRESYIYFLNFIYVKYSLIKRFSNFFSKEFYKIIVILQFYSYTQLINISNLIKLTENVTLAF